MFDLLVTTGAGNVPMGGSDIWVNNFLQYVVPHLNYPIVLLIDGKKPVGFEPSSIPCQFVFSKEQPLLVGPLLRNCRKIHFLHNNYFRRDELWEHREKFDTIFVMCPTESINKFDSNLTEDDNMFDEWLEERVEKLIQKKKQHQCRQQERIL